MKKCLQKYLTEYLPPTMPPPHTHTQISWSLRKDQGFPGTKYDNLAQAANYSNAIEKQPCPQTGDNYFLSGGSINL